MRTLEVFNWLRIPDSGAKLHREAEAKDETV